MELIVSAISINGDDNLNIELMAPTGAELPPFAPGAHIDIRTPAGHLRQYSLCGPADDRRHYNICVRKDHASRGGSRTLHDDLRVRQKIEVSNPRNLFALPEAMRYILLSAGIGITPIISMARQLTADGADFEWHHFERHRSRVAFLHELTKELLNGKSTLHLGEDGQSFRHTILTCLVDPEPGTAILACGPNGFLDLLTTRLNEAGWPPNQIHSERFQPETPTSQAATQSESFEVRIASSGKSFMIGTADTIANVLRKNGIEVELSCEQGMCGACLTRVLEGQPDHRDIVLSATEKEAGNQMTICCSRAKSTLLVLDL